MRCVTKFCRSKLTRNKPNDDGPGAEQSDQFHLNALDHRSDQFAATDPVEQLQFGTHLGAEHLQPSNDELQICFLPSLGSHLPSLSFERTQPLLEAANTRLGFGLLEVDHGRVAADAAGCHSTGTCEPLPRARRPARGYSPAVRRAISREIEGCGRRWVVEQLLERREAFGVEREVGLIEQQCFGIPVGRGHETTLRLLSVRALGS